MSKKCFCRQSLERLQCGLRNPKEEKSTVCGRDKVKKRSSILSSALRRPEIQVVNFSYCSRLVWKRICSRFRWQYLDYYKDIITRDEIQITESDNLKKGYLKNN
ncbi:UNVERIFIED_CONTAM: hypothetical protein RMT77_009573 [Armadillidium vulgare]